MYSLLPDVVMAALPCRPWLAMMACTSAGDGVPSLKWISQTVPPVKSIENFRPSLPPVIGVNRMKMIPGIMISALKM